MSEKEKIPFEHCPKCGDLGEYVGYVDGKFKVIACKCGYNVPGMVVAGTQTPPNKMRELKEYADKATEDLRARIAELENELANERDTRRNELSSNALMAIAKGNQETLHQYNQWLIEDDRKNRAQAVRIGELESLLRECESMLLYCHNYVPTSAMDMVNKLHGKVMDAVGQP